MPKKSFLFVAAAFLAVILFQAGPHFLLGQTTPSAALTGQVKSTEEGPMEGVLVSAKKSGSTVTVTVVTDQQGRYSFPRNKLEPGQYTLQIRAIGYELDDPGAVEVPAQTAATADLKLHQAKDLSQQLSNGEWLLSVPGTPQQKAGLLNCVVCHTLQRVVRSNHDAAEFLPTIQRMAGYANQSTPIHPQRRLANRLIEERGDQLQDSQRQMAEYFSTLNLSAVTKWEYPLKTYARPKGNATRVVITEYDLPKKTMEPHDVIVDSEGMVWFSDFGEQTLGKLDPKTAKVTDYPVPELKHGSPIGGLGLQFDKDQNLWLGMMYQGALGKFDKKAEKFQTFSMPPEFNKEMTQINMVRPERESVDGKIWTQNNGFASIHRLDVATGEYETFQPFRDTPKGQNHNIYDIVPDSKNNLYFTDFANEHIGRVDAKTGKITFYQAPTLHSAPRRAMMDSQDRLWFAEYRANKVAMFDTKTEKFQEWTAPTPWSNPYDVVLDKNGELWTGSVVSDRVLRLDPKTGKSIEYLLPRSTNIRRVFVDNSTTPVTFWVGSNHGASIVKVEPLN